MEAREGRTYHVSLLAAMVLLHALTKGAQHPKVGFADTEHTLRELRGRLNAMGRVSLTKPMLESLLWSANLLDERGAFWHPDKKTFEQFLGDVLHEGETFNRYYNLVESTGKLSNKKEGSS